MRSALPGQTWFLIVKKENNPLELECVVDADPEAEITWFRNTNEISENDVTFNQYGDKHSKNTERSRTYPSKAQAKIKVQKLSQT